MKEGGRSEMEKERTRERERRRRSITTKIFHGLRKHGGYTLSPRADINEVLRELAREAGWIIEPDGTTYRSDSTVVNCCHICGAAKASNGMNNTNTTPTSSVIISPGSGGGIVGGGGGEISTGASNGYAAFNYNSIFGEMVGGGGSVPYTLHFCNEMASAAVGMETRQEQQGIVVLQETRASNTNTPIGSPLHCTR